MVEENIFKGLEVFLDDEFIRFLKVFVDNEVVKPIDLISMLKCGRGKAYNYINKFLRMHLVHKVGRGRYMISKKGKKLFSLLTEYSLADKSVFDVDGSIDLDMYVEPLKRFLGPYVNPNLINEVLDDLGLNGPFYREDLILLIAHYLVKNQLQTAFREVSRRTLFIESFDRGYLYLALKRKVLEHSINPSILHLFSESILSLDELRVPSLKPFNVFCKNLSPYPEIINVVYYSGSSLLKNISMYSDITLNITYRDYLDSGYSLVRSNRGNIRRYIIHGDVKDLVKDDLLLNMIINDSRNGVDTYIFMSGGLRRVIDHEGFSVAIEAVGGKCIYNVSKLFIDISRLSKWILEKLGSRIFIRSIGNYVGELRRLFGLGDSAHVSLFIVLRHLVDKYMMDVVELIKDISEELSGNNVSVYPYLYTDLPEVGKYIDLFNDRFLDISYPYRELEPVDVHDLRFLLTRFGGLRGSFVRVIG